MQIRTEEAEEDRWCRPEEAHRRRRSGGEALGDRCTPVGGLSSAGDGPWHPGHKGDVCNGSGSDGGEC